ncbi:MAG: DUF4351 domain-containing protein [Xenococcus sp. (in: cyanobacteria)]
MRESIIYQDILEKATAQGKAEGIKEGEAQGIKKGEVSLVLRQLKLRIGTINAEDESQITALSVEQLEALGEALLDFSSSDYLSDWLAEN